MIMILLRRSFYYILGNITLMSTVSCASPRAKKDTETPIHVSMRFMDKCIFAKSISVPPARRTADFPLQIYGGYMTPPTAESVDHLLAEYQMIFSPLCYDIPLGPGQGRELLLKILRFYKAQLAHDIDIFHPTYFSYGLEGRNWLIIYEFTDPTQKRSYMQIELPAPTDYKASKIYKSLADVIVNEEEIISAYQKFGGRTPYTRNIDPTQCRKLNMCDDSREIQSMKGTAGYIKIDFFWDNHSPWRCKPATAYENCEWKE